MNIRKIIIHHDPKPFEALVTTMITPPEPYSVHFMVWPPEYRDICILQLFKVSCYLIGTLLPCFVKISTFCYQLIPFFRCRTILHCPDGSPVAAITICRITPMPHKGDDVSFFVFLSYLFDHQVTGPGQGDIKKLRLRHSRSIAGRISSHECFYRKGRQIGRSAMLVTHGILSLDTKAEIGSPDYCLLTCHLLKLITVFRSLSTEIMLSRESILTLYILDEIIQVSCFRRYIGINRIDILFSIISAGKQYYYHCQDQ